MCVFFFFLIAFLPSGCIVSWKWVFFAGGVGNSARLDMAGQGTLVQRRPAWESSLRDAWAGWSCWHVDPVTPLQSQVQPSIFHLFVWQPVSVFNGKLIGNLPVAFCLIVGLFDVFLWSKLAVVIQTVKVSDYLLICWTQHCFLSMDRNIDR